TSSRATRTGATAGRRGSRPRRRCSRGGAGRAPRSGPWRASPRRCSRAPRPPGRPDVAGAGAVLVTGGAGYVGSHVARALAAAGRSVVVLDDLSAGRASSVRWGPLVRGDVLDRDLVRRTCRAHGVGSVVHLAGRISVEE